MSQKQTVLRQQNAVSVLASAEGKSEMALYGYARCSLAQQSVGAQVELLKDAGCTKVFTDEGVSGAQSARAGYQAMLETLRPGDTVLVLKLDRLARSTRDLLNKIDDLTERGVGFRSLTEHIDINTAVGELLLHVLGSIASFERSLLQERTRIGIEHARRAGKRIGRPPAMTTSQIETARNLQKRSVPVSVIASRFGVSRSCLYRYLKDAA